MNDDDGGDGDDDDGDYDDKEGDDDKEGKIDRRWNWCCWATKSHGYWWCALIATD